MSNVHEYWFSKHYRVTVVKNSDGSFLASVDVYRRGWFLDDYEELCLEDGRTCLIYKVIVNPEPLLHEVRIDKVIVTGVKIKDSVETVNVRWIGYGDVNEDVAKKFFEESWRIVKCKPPTTGVWRFNCIE
ncbi:MAG: hypothetical protein QXP72_02065 [Desulfurococcaceae archaeon]